MKYLILINSIADMGGGQQYCRNKVVELKRRGYSVFVFSAIKGEVLIHDLREFSGLIIPEIMYCPSCFTKTNINKVINVINDKVGGIDEKTIIDCAGVINAEWGELIAEKFKCKSVCFAIDEFFEVSRSELSFLKFKHNRYELAGTSNKTIKMLFGNSYCIDDSECYAFNALCTNVVDNVESKIEKIIDKKRVTIGCLGRLDKSYVIRSLCLIKNYVLDNNDDLFNIIVIGGGSTNRYDKEIKSLFKECDNVELYVTGYLFPIPRKLMGCIDVCIASSGCAITCVEEGVPTIYVNVNSGKPIGVANYDVKMGIDHRYDENYQPMNRILDLIIKEDYCSRHDPIDVLVHLDYESIISYEIESQLKFINKDVIRSYYDISKIKQNGLKFSLYKLLGKVFGGRVLYNIHLNVLHKIKPIL